MDKDTLLYCAIIGFGIIAISGFFWTKKEGFGRFNTATLLMLVVFIISSLFAIKGIFDKNTIVNIVFTIIGFSGGLFTKESRNDV